MKNYKFTINGNEYEVEILNFEDNSAKIEVNGTPYEVEIQQEVKKTKTPKLVRSAVPKTDGNIKKVASSGSQVIKAPLPGNILEIKVKAGDAVKKGDKLLIMEAMKMENNVLAEKDGTVKDVKVNNGDSVLQGDVLVEIE